MGTGCSQTLDAKVLTSKLKMMNLTQVELAKALGVSQSQVSRVLSGQCSRRTKLLNEICNYVNTRHTGVTPQRVRENDDLICAVADCWDGTSKHAEALAVVIRSLALLKRTGLPQRIKQSR
jgi:transcriptional regulator with XRE-family HTH domain